MDSQHSDFVEVKIKALIADPESQSPVVVLQHEGQTNLLPIWVGPFEAQAIAMAIEHIEPPRPMTHDLLLSVIEQAGFTVHTVKVHSLKDNVFRATILLLDREGRLLSVDSRPSDAFALAVRAQVPIFVAQAVMNEASVPEYPMEEALKKLLEKLDPEDLGDYEM